MSCGPAPAHAMLDALSIDGKLTLVWTEALRALVCMLAIFVYSGPENASAIDSQWARSCLHCRKGGPWRG